MANSSHLDDSEFKRIAESNLKKISSPISKIGYSDGIAEGREFAFQKGFDVGYKDGFKGAFEIQKHILFSQIVCKNKSGFNSDLIEEAEKLSIESDKKYLTCTNRNLSLNEISANQNAFIDTKIGKIKECFPKISNLLG